MNRQNILKAKPIGMPDFGNFSFRETPEHPLQHLELLIKSRIILVDPYMRGSMLNEEHLIGL